ncbi:hypothetical protein [Anaerosacchariphilus polymeriproducens]|uniref:DUF5610 domain-containing protein n=1 Tax=Anaerosacchariphilus polymeriproducens TaxID=1812858 RepID=A0A371AV85_9FIRM|nr:hypothetical protein [Anaerosacchariphilus polymeriproducens]RDU23452.1 hypothetical protein DWV06_09615 [Anaerosacchariphilus polymeriproducens]
MNINGINNVTSVPKQSDPSIEYGTTSTDKPHSTQTDVATGVIYEKSKNIEKNSEKNTQSTDIINQLKADVEQRTSQLRTLVEKMMTQQGKTIGKADDIWSFLASGDFTVDAETKAQAQEDISEDGYWGVEQTSERIVEFAKALSGGDPSKSQAMKDAFIEGFNAATKAWGKELPSISKDTYDAVMNKFDEWSQEESNK